MIATDFARDAAQRAPKVGNSTVDVPYIMITAAGRRALKE